MKLFKLSKLNIIALILVASVAVIAATAGGTIAYFSDNKQMTNVFTAGDVAITLSEAAVKSDGMGNMIEDPDAPRIYGVDVDSTEEAINDYGALYPGKEMYKDPTIKNVGDENAWIAAKVIIDDGGKNINAIYGYENAEEIDIHAMLGGALLDQTMHVSDDNWNGFNGYCYNDNYVMAQKASVTTGIYEFYFFMKASVAPGDAVVLFDTMYIDELFGNVEMQHLSSLRITVQAFAVQTHGFADCHTAMTRAFPEHFAAGGATN